MVIRKPNEPLTHAAQRQILADLNRSIFLRNAKLVGDIEVAPANEDETEISVKFTIRLP